MFSGALPRRSRVGLPDAVAVVSPGGRRQGPRSWVSETQEQGPDEAGAGGSRGPARGSDGPGATLSRPRGTQPLSVEPEPGALQSADACKDPKEPAAQQLPRPPGTAQGSHAASRYVCRRAGPAALLGCGVCGRCPSLLPSPLGFLSALSASCRTPPSSQQTQPFTPPSARAGAAATRRPPAAAGFAESWR